MKDGIVILNKEKGLTSHDAVFKLRKILQQKKTGHIGTLDPQAEGVLPVLTGKATKLAELFSGQDKVYTGEIIFGIETDTGDLTGNVICKNDLGDAEKWLNENREDIEKAIYSFRGDYMQIPPMYSAKKIDGKKLYQYAREGVQIERKAAKVRIISIELKDLYIKEGMPSGKIRVRCSKGTYIRTLCSDIGERLGIKAAMGDLTRTAAGDFTLEHAYRLKEIEALTDKDSCIISMDELLKGFEKIDLDEKCSFTVKNGNKIRKRDIFSNDADIKGDPADIYRMYSKEGDLMALYIDEGEWLRPYKMFV